ncbi:class I SAM-dependent methyltransferase [Streptomyces sp. NPDC054884]|uniref:class I SAM-dependent methyltransferase n=1 Tax=Streptomyces sp. ME08-AFT2 TaxID=3028683 RepID=UPI0029B82181|nr:class I SAM-dependent methyltransferase [Streptomyces sp. ME08-AFT2]MDX3314385.1 class I SAM-dependent methyltransferase [Streptomyces sp. ME08-AFT2]
MPDGWEWDSSLFRGSAAYYERGRLPYAPGFAETVADALGLDGRGRLLDVGCGPGIVLIALAPYFAEAVGVDPDEAMLAAARRRAVRHGVAARWTAARAEDLPAGLGEFRAVVFAQSFHWTDRDSVAATVLRMLEPGGVFVHVSDHKNPPPDPRPLPSPAPPYDRIGALVRRYVGPVRRAGRGVLVNGTPGREDLVMARAGFVDFRRLVVPAGGVVERTADDLVAWAFSRSDSAPHLFGDRLGDFERELRALLREEAPDDRFAERLPPTEVMTWRTPR